MKKALVILMAALMLALSACTQSGAPAGGQSSQTTAAATQNAEAEQKAKEEAEKKAKEEAERKAKEEAEKKAKEEAERLAKEEAERLAKEEAERQELAAALEEAYEAANWRAVKAAADALTQGFPDSAEAEAAQGYAEEAAAHLKEVGEKALANMKTQVDKVENRTWYYPKTAPTYTNDRTCFYIYFGQSGTGAVWLRCVANYTGDDWIFFEKLTYSIDGKNTSKTMARDEYYRDNAYGDVWEVADYGMGNTTTGIPDSDRAFLESIINSEETIIRFQGDNYHYDHTVTKKEKDGLVEAMAAFDYLFDQYQAQ